VLGWQKFRSYLAENLSPDRNESINPNENIDIIFVVDTLGDLKNFKIANAKDGFDKEIIRVLKIGPKWQSAIVNGKKVSQKINLPIQLPEFDEVEEIKNLEIQPDLFDARLTGNNDFQNND